MILRCRISYQTDVALVCHAMIFAWHHHRYTLATTACRYTKCMSAMRLVMPICGAALSQQGLLTHEVPSHRQSALESIRRNHVPESLDTILRHTHIIEIGMG